MATHGAIVGAIALVILFTLAAGCTLWTAPSGPSKSGMPQVVTPASTGAGGAGETPVPSPTTVLTTPTPIMVATIAVPTATPTATATPTPITTPTSAPAPVETAATTVAPTLEPAPVPTGTGTIAELAAADPELSRFTQALRQGGIYEILNGTGTYTVFAPDDAAFDAVPPGTLSRLLFDREALASVANYHVAYGRWLSADLACESSVATRAGMPLAVTVLPDGTLQVDDARVTRSDLVATNGVLHVIDRVMIPSGTL